MGVPLSSWKSAEIDVLKSEILKKNSSFIEKINFGGQGLGLARGLANTLLSYASCTRIHAFLLRERSCLFRFTAWLRTDENAWFQEACDSQ